MCKRPILRWHGGKWKLAPWIIQHLPSHRIYVEPFGGAASVLLSKGRSHAEVYNDLDGELVNLFRVVRDRGDELRRLLRLTPFAREEFDLAYLPADDPLERARRLVVRAAMGRDSAAASRSKRASFRSYTGELRTTTPADDWCSYPDALPAMIARLRGVIIERRDARLVMVEHDSEQTVHYVDPPYLPACRDQGADYRHEMTEDDHVRLATTLHSLSGTVLLSGYDSPLYHELYASWHHLERPSHADGARERTEVLWLSPRRWQPSQPSLFDSIADGGTEVQFGRSQAFGGSD